MKFVGMIAFLDSNERTDRFTNVMSFAISASWFESVRDYFNQEIMNGHYDGTEVLINVYEYKGEREVFDVPEDDFHYDSENLVHVSSLKNPYYV